MENKTINDRAQVWIDAGFQVDAPLTGHDDGYCSITGLELVETELDKHLGMVCFHCSKIWHTGLSLTSHPKIGDLCKSAKKYLNRIGTLKSDVVKVQCPDCKRERWISPITYRNIESGDSSGRCKSCAQMKRLENRKHIYKLNYALAEVIRERWHNGDLPLDMAKEYGVHHSCIYKIINNQTYRREER